jgi:protein-tyrosine phosphatase
MIVDFHSHILPGVDHGSDSIATSVKQLTLAKNAGIEGIISTSHFYPHKHKVDNFIKRRNEAYKSLYENFNANMPINVRLCAEVLVCAGIEKLPGLSELCLYGTKTILLGPPFTEFKDEYAKSVEITISNGFDVLRAHAARSNSRNIDYLVDMGAKIQLNASALTGLFKNKTYYGWISDGCVVGLGSDIHMSDKNAYNNFTKAAKKLGSDFSLIMEKSTQIWNNSKEF